jgi:hypothetical protein
MIETMSSAMDLKTLQDTPPWEWPLDAGQTFLKFLIDPRARESDRLIAADLAGDSVVIDDELAEALLTIVGSATDSDELRAKAVISLGPVLELADTDGFDDPDMLPPITERRFRKIQHSLRKLYSDSSTPKEVRRRILEASVRAPEAWHEDAIKEAYASGDREWMLTAVFGMRHVRGFDEQILQALDNPDPEIHYEAVLAAGGWALEGAWSHVLELVEDPETPKPLLLAAIGAVGEIRPAEARKVLQEFAESEDEEIAEAADEAIMMAEGREDEEENEDEEEEGEWVN